MQHGEPFSHVFPLIPHARDKDLKSLSSLMKLPPYYKNRVNHQLNPMYFILGGWTKKLLMICSLIHLNMSLRDTIMYCTIIGYSHTYKDLSYLVPHTVCSV